MDLLFCGIQLYHLALLRPVTTSELGIVASYIGICVDRGFSDKCGPVFMMVLPFLGTRGFDLRGTTPLSFCIRNREAVNGFSASSERFEKCD